MLFLLATSTIKHLPSKGARQIWGMCVCVYLPCLLPRVGRCLGPLGGQIDVPRAEFHPSEFLYNVAVDWWQGMEVSGML